MSPTNISRHHADWLSLVEVSGPFVSLPVLMRTFPQGLEPRDSFQVKALRAAYGEWQTNPSAPGTQRAWVMQVLVGLLGYPQEQIAEGQLLPAGLEAKMPELGETLRPDWALFGAAGDDIAARAQLLIVSYPIEQALDKPVNGKHWKASPATRMMELLHGANVQLGLITNGEQWMLVYAPRGETTGYASWYGALWLDEPITLRAFHSLLGVRRFFGVAAKSTLVALLEESANDQQEVTDQLGYQVREAVEALVQSFDVLDKESNRTLLNNVSPASLYDATLTIMMRLVFLFSAEERGLLHLGKPLYDDNYAVSTLQEQLQAIADNHGEEVLERRFDAWARLLAAFRAVHGGVQHQDLLLLAYGGSLFDPDRYPFLEGRAAQTSWKTTAAEPLAVNNRTVLHLLNSLQRLQIKVPGGGPAESRRISFRALGVEQIGHVYEGLLDRTAIRARDPVIGMKGARDKQREIALATLEALSVQGRDKLVEFLKDETGRSVGALRRDLDDAAPLDEHKLMIACSHNRMLLDQIRPLANLIREDSFGRPLVVLTDSIYVTAATTRRSTGTHYTPPSLTEPIVQHTLEPLVYEGPAEGYSREQWKLKTPKAILDLNICDMAMGSGAFLVQTCRYMAERLVEAWESLERQHPGETLITPEGAFSAGSPTERLVPVDTDERIAIARRLVADRCLYGVDINSMAVEMAKLSLWLITSQRDRPFSFLDHALKCGDSLLGVSAVKQIENFSLRPDERQITFASANMFQYVQESSAKRRVLEDLPSNDTSQIEAKIRLHAEAGRATAKVKALADCLIALELRGLNGNAYGEQRTASAEEAELEMRKPLLEFQAYAHEQLHGRCPFHWAIEFPEVFERGGFDALVGNPPYLGAPKLTGAFGNDYREFLITNLAHGVKGLADWCAYFLLRTEVLISANGFTGLVVTSAIAEGDTRTVGLQQLADSGWEIIRATSRAPWPGSASVTYSSIWLSPGKWGGNVVLNNENVSGVTPMLTVRQEVSGPPHRLKANLKKSFNGVKVYGEGFVLPPEEAFALIKKDARNKSVLFPYITTKDVNSHHTHEPSAWAIRFFDWPLDRESAPVGYSGPVAQDFPDCLTIVEARVKPERTRRDENGEFVVRDPKPRLWWIYGELCRGLYAAISGLKHVLAVGTQATKYVAFATLDKDMVFSHSLAIIADDSFETFAVLHSNLHEVWARNYGGYNLALLRYAPTDLFETFPFPPRAENLERIGLAYYECRRSIMVARQEGLTDVYNRIHDPDEKSEDIMQLRASQMEMDQAVVAAYGWTDVDLGHGFQETKQGMRYTISESARRDVLDLLLALNHQRHDDEDSEEIARAASAPVKRGRKRRGGSDKLTLDLL